MTEKRIHKFIKFKASANEKFKIQGSGLNGLAFTMTALQGLALASASCESQESKQNYCAA